MNYLGTVSILDRGDAPAQAVIDKNSRSLAQRVANETKEELEKVMNRVDNICQNFEMTNEYNTDFSSNMEFVSDIAELTEILQDQVKKKKYQAQVTVFVVGFQEVSSQKLKLLQQVNEFFLDSIKNFEEDDKPSTPNIDLDDVAYKIDESLDVARGLANRLGDLNQDIIEFLIHYAENKAKNKSAQGEGKGKKKLEKALQAAKDDIGSISEKLLSVQSDLEDKEEKMQQLYKQLEIKTLENQKYKSAAEIAKKNLLDSQALKDDISMRDEKMKDMRQIISRLEIDLAQAQHSHEQSQNRLENSSIESQQKLLELQKGVDSNRMQTNDAKREMEKVHESQINNMSESHSKEIDELKEQHADEIDRLADEIDSLKEQVIKANIEKSFSLDGDVVKHFDLDTSDSSQDPSRQSSRQDSRSGSRNNGPGSNNKINAKSKSVNDGDSTVEETFKTKRSKSTLETVSEGDGFENVFDLKDEIAWASVPPADIPGRFNQFRKLSRSYNKDLEGKIQLTLARMHRKVQTLKSQFHEHKTKWDLERKLLIDQVNQAQGLQTDAEKEADSTITQLEHFITDQEQLEIEEAKKRQEMAISVDLLTTVVPSGVQPTVTNEDDIQKLMQQTDDAKALATTVTEDVKNIDIKETFSPGSTLPPVQQYVIKNLKIMMADPEDKLPAYQLKILESVRLALKILKAAKVDLADDEILRSVTIVCLASQLTHESMQLGVRPDSLFKTLAILSKRLLDEKESELRLLLENTIDDGFSEISFESGTEGEASISTLRELPLLDDISEKDVTHEKSSKTEITIEESDNNVKEGHIEEQEEQVVIVSLPLNISSPMSVLTSKLEDSSDDENTFNPKITIKDGSSEAQKSTLKGSSISERSFTTTSPLSDISDNRQYSRASQTDSTFGVSFKPNSVVGKASNDSKIDDDIRASSAKSRQSLRSHYLSKIEDSKRAAEDRKSKSAALSESIKQVKDREDKLFDEDQDEYLKGFGYSDSGELLPEHPVVQEYFKTYNISVGFKDAISKTLLDKDMMSPSQIISDLEIHKFKQNAQVLPQLEKMTKNINMVLDEIINVFNGILVNERDPPVSSMMNLSRDPTILSREKTPESATPCPPNVHNQQGSDNVDNEYINDLQKQCHLLRNHIDDSSKKYEEQLRHNTVVMMEMQDTINSLQIELSTLGKAPRSRSVTPGSQYNQVPSPETSIMFTRLDSERNAKIMKKAVNDDKLDPNKYKKAVSQMDQYISLPALRMGQLVRKYIHHYRMKYIEETVQKSQSLDEGVYDILDKMEELQNQRAQRWAEKMDAMGTERLKMANLLMETLDNIENESGIFLIKPMYSYRGRELQQRYTGKLSRPTKSRKSKSVIKDVHSSYGPAPTPASNIRSIHQEITLQTPESGYGPVTPKTFEGTGGGVSGAAVNWVGISSNSTWNMADSQTKMLKDDVSSFYNTPRILELDINRMLIGHNNISTRLTHPLTDDRLVNASHNTLRTYVTVNRPSMQPRSIDRPHSVTDIHDSSAPPSTPQPPSSAGIRRHVDDFPPKLPGTPPLPPINKNRNTSASSLSSSLDNSQIKHRRIYSGKTTTSDED